MGLPSAKLDADSANSSASALFKIKDLTKIYATGDVAVRALDGVTLELNRGEMNVLLGPSGSGKSTLLNIIGGLDRATSGTVHFADTNLTELSESALTRYRRNHVGFVFQFYNLIPSLSARENVRLVTELSKDPMPVDEALDMVDLLDRASHFPAELSGGEQQRVAIARALAKKPDVLLCDEPTGALDSHTGVIVLEALARINADLGTTTAIITHNIGISAMAHRVIYFSDGKVSRTESNNTLASPSDITW